MESIPVNTISLEEAIAWTKEWRNEAKVKDISLKGFVIPKNDLINVLNQPDIGAVRVYLSKVDKDSEGIKKGENKLLIVACKLIDGVWRDMLPVRINRESDPVGDRYFIYDFTDPCPPDCDGESLLSK